MRKIYVLGLAVLSLSGSAFADGAPTYWKGTPGLYNTYGINLCALGRYFDAYGLGIESGFRGVNLKASLGAGADRQCFDVGVSTGRKYRELDTSECRTDFEDGYKQGMLSSEYSAGRECYGAGYQAGKAALTNGARAKNSALVTQACVDAYVQGERDAREKAPAVYQASLKLNACYQSGYWDGSTP